MNTSNRLYFLDNLRAFVVLLVIVLHGSMTYMAYAPEWWYVLDSQNSLFYTMLVLLIDVPIMPILFFLAGYFALSSLQKRGSAQFLKDKLLRIGIPWIFGVLFLAPLSAYMIYYSRQVPMDYLTFWRTDFWGVMYQQSVYWFLGILFALFIVLALAGKLSSRLRDATQKVVLPTWKVYIVFVGIMTAGFFLATLFYPLDFWTHNYIFVYQPERVPLYIGYFVLGILAYLWAWFADDGYKPKPVSWGVACLVFGVAYLGVRIAFGAVLPTSAALKAINALFFNAFCFTALMAGAAFFQNFVNRATPIWQSLSASSYGIYYIHPLILYPLAYLLVGITLPLFAKWLLLILTTILICWGLSALILKKVPLLRDMF